MKYSSEIANFSRQKKGMSPLIATVLLIAFAVALGAMIMNWSSSIGTGSPDCSGIGLIINPYICYTQNLLRISVQNTGEPIESLTVRAADASGNEVSFKYNSQMAEGEILTKDFPFEKTTKTIIELIPSIKSGDDLINCDKPALVVSDLKECTN